MHRDMHNTVGLRDVIIDSNEKCTRELVEICGVGGIGDVRVQKDGAVDWYAVLQSEGEGVDDRVSYTQTDEEALSHTLTET